MCLQNPIPLHKIINKKSPSDKFHNYQVTIGFVCFVVPFYLQVDGVNLPFFELPISGGNLIMATSYITTLDNTNQPDDVEVGSLTQPVVTYALTC